MMKVKPETYWDADELEALREILLEEDREAITYLAEQIVNLRDNPVEPEVLRKHLQAMLPEALAQENRNLSPEKAARWGPLVIAAIKQQAEESPAQVVEALHPVMGKLIRAHLSASVQNIFKREQKKTTTPKKDGPTLKQRMARTPRAVETSSTPLHTSPEQLRREAKLEEPYQIHPQPRKRARGTPKMPTLVDRRTMLTYLLVVVLLGALITIPVWWFFGRDSSSDAIVPGTDLGTQSSQAVSPQPGGDTSSTVSSSDTQGQQTEDGAAQAEINLLVADAPLLFELNQQGLPDRGRVILDRIAPILRKYPGTQLEIHVYTDNVGPDSVNKQISQSRADSIKRYLSTDGRITPSRLTPIGHGSENPISSNDTLTGQRANRRAEFRVVPK